LLLGKQQDFVRTVTEKLMTYALGRGVEHYDMPVVRQLLRDAASNGNRWSVLVQGIVASAPFQHRQVEREQRTQ
jgi:hypothetical protein